MIKDKVLSSLEMLKSAKPRVTLIIKNVLENLIYLTENNYSQNLSEFKNLCLNIKKHNILDVSSFLSKNIIDYNCEIINYKSENLINIEFIFIEGFPIKNIEIKNLKI